ncbi:PAS domain S-box-containing protein [Rhodopseudomonas rhenobacensis]|uniref:histidine kinase n=1 Tax=Rhodopseudomonas rhenobacensis TaxID=87461 RepID=A0A7W8E059_9BRAD|nr:ATP-binding protein [Rhodopseudomonas rhenobacensis]MBB5048575.1 PAS domain S-box-containing protein [Rhodopseudomonas rhenobacensis]
MSQGLSLSTRLTIAIVALVVATAGTVGYLSYRNIAGVAVPRALVRLDAHTRSVAVELADIVNDVRADLTGFRDVIGLEEIIALSRDPGTREAGGQTLAQWRARIARRFAAELEAKPHFAQFRIIGAADGGREMVRVDRHAENGRARIVSDADLQQKASRGYFRQAVAAPDGAVLVSPIELNQEYGRIELPPQPVIRVLTPIYAPDGQWFGLLIVNIDLRPAFAAIKSHTSPDTSVYVVNDRGDYLVHPDPEREFGFEFGMPFRVQNDFPETAAALASGEPRQPELVEHRGGTRYGLALASMRLGGGPLVSVIEVIPEEKIVALALQALRDSSLLGGTIAVLCAMLLAFVLARTLTRQLTQMTAAVAGFAQGKPLLVPLNAGGEIGVLARAFQNMVQEVGEKTTAIRREKDVFQSIMAAMAEAVLLIDAEGNIVYANRANQELLGPIELEGTGWRELYDIYQPDGTTLLPRQHWPSARCLLGEQVDGFELVCRRRDNGKSIHVMGSAHPIRDAGGALSGAVVVYRDVSAAKEIERQLRQSQKLDAIGQLTGGVAHDFNNTLTVITGTAEILIENLADRPGMQQIAKMIDEAAGRGAELTKHLLAFARRQPLQPRNVDVNTLVLNTAQLLRPTLGEHIEIESMLGNDAEPAHIDPSQLSTALLNLAVNARDAMPNGGKLTLETGNVVLDEAYAEANPEVAPGPYVMIAVSDTGTGIPAAIRDKVFEPFFTTKDVGKGTGLGLSMVYGFVKQSNGHIKIYSEEGYGTTIKLYLPRASAEAEELAPTAPIKGGSETVLVVEDDAMVRNFVVTQLRSLGYKTLMAANGAETLAQIDAGASFDLLFTDVIMPGLNGRQLADAVKQRRPGTKVLYTSGYTENAIVHHGRLDPGVLLLPKPYRKSELARLIRAALNAEAGADADTGPTVETMDRAGS